jgi:hypothetical protein
MRACSIIAVLLLDLGSPAFSSDFYQQYLSVVDTNRVTQPLGAFPMLVDTNNTGAKMTNAVLDVASLKRSGEVSGVRLGMTMQEAVDRWGKPRAGWTHCLHGLITFSYTKATLGFDGDRLETIRFIPPATLAGGLSSKAQVEEFVRVLGEPTSRVGSADRGSLTYLSAGANLRLEFWDEGLEGIYLERTPSRAEPWKQIVGANPQGRANGGQPVRSQTNQTPATAAPRRSP